MLKLLVAGGFVEDDKQSQTDQQEFARLLGKEIIDQGHILLNGCMTEFDKVICESAFNRIQERKEDPGSRIFSYVLANQEPIHTFGNVRESQLSNWELGSPKLRVPEPIDSADAVILVSGYEGTHRAANWARIAKKPLLPVTRFGGAAKQVFAEELDEFAARYRMRVSKSQYEDLSQVNSPVDSLAKTVVMLAEALQASRSVFVIMSFSDDPLLTDAYESFREVCKEFKYECQRIDNESDVPRILPQILYRISESAFVIVDLSVQSPNVYYELGYADASGQPIIVTAKKGTVLPFDVKDIPVTFWVNQTSLKDDLRKKVEAIATTQGH